MTTERGARPARVVTARGVGRTSLVVVFIIALLRLAGGLLHVTLLTSVAPSWTEMKTVTMVCFLLGAAALALIYLRPANSRRSISAILLGGMVTLVGLATIADYASQLVVGRASAVTQAPFLNLFFAAHTRMALITAVVFALVGLALVLLATGTRRAAHVAHALTFPAATLSYMVTLSYLLGVQSMSAVLGTPMALNTGLAFFFLCVAVFCARSDTWLMKAFASDEVGGLMARRLLPGLMATPLVVGWLRLQGERTGLFTSEVGVALVAATYTVVFVVLVWLAARAANRTDARRRAAEQATRESEEQFRAVSESSAVQLVVTRLSDNVILFTNAAFDLAFGYAPGELVGSNAPEMYVDPAERAALISAVNEKGLVENFEVRVKRRDGTQFWASTSVRRLQFAGAPAILGAAIDITARKRTEEALRLSEQRFALAFANNPAAIALTGLDDGIFLDVNDTWVALTGYTRDEAIGHSARQMRIWPSAESASRFVEELKAKGALHGWEQEFLKKSGDVYVAELSAQLLTIHGERVILSTLLDITTRKRAEDAVAADLAALTMLQKLGTTFVSEGNLEPILGQVVETAIAICGADFGNIQLIEPESGDLRIKAQRGFPEWWLDFWDRVSVGTGTCGTALARGERVIVEDVEQSLIFAGKPGLEIQRRAGVRAVQSTPLVSRSGKPLGMFSTHYRSPHRFDQRVLAHLDLLARQAADIIERAQAEVALREGAARLQSILEATQESIWLFSTDGRILGANGTAAARFRLKPADVVGKRLDEILSPELSRSRFERIREVADSGQSVEFEDERAGMQFRHSFYPVLDAGGSVTAVVSFSRDITESRRAEQALRVSEERFRAVAFHTPDHILVQDRELRYELVVNPQLGLTEQDMLGKTDYDFLSESDADRLTAMKRQVMQTGQPLHVEAPLTSAKGELEFFDGTYVPRLDAQGRSNGVIGYFRNVTERKRAEQTVRESEERLRRLYSAMSEGLALHQMVYDDSGKVTDYRILDVNPAFEAITGINRGKAVGLLASELYGTGTPPYFDIYAKVAETAEPTEFETEFAPMAKCFHISVFSPGKGIFATVFSDITVRKQTERTLAEQAAMLASANDAIIGYDTNYRVTFWNRSAELMYGYGEAEALGKVSAELLHPVYVGVTREQLVERLAADGHVETESIRTTRDGRQLSVEAHVIALKDEQGRTTGYVSVDRDTTERKLDEARVARLAKLYAVLSRVNETIVRTRDARVLYSEVCRIVSEEGGFPLAWVGIVDGKQVVPVACCGTACDYLKEVSVETEGELGNGPTGVSIREDRAVVNDDFAANPATAPWRQPALRYGFRSSASFPLHRKGKVVGAFTLYASEPGEFDAEQVGLFQALSADVSYAIEAIDQERLRAEAERALREAKETLEVKVTERTADLTAEIDERKRAEQRLTALSQYARSLLEASLDPLVTISAEGKITDVNEATIMVTGATRVELIGTDFSDYFTEPQKARAGYQRVFAAGFVTDYPLTIRHRDGRLTDVFYNASVYRDARGNVTGVFAAARDVTARKRAEKALQEAYDTLEVKVAERTAELKRSNEELEQFAYVASHDLQEPLRMVASYVELLAQRYKGRLDEKADRYIAYASGGAVRMHRLVNDLLAFSRVGTRGAPMVPVSLDRVVAQARENLTIAIEQSGAEVRVAHLPTVSGDETQLVQLFQNLIDNAIKFRGNEPPRIRITAEWIKKSRIQGFEPDRKTPDGSTLDPSNPRPLESSFWVISVADNGIGIDPKHQDRIFRLFQRLHTEQEYPGTGIGLAVCKKIVERQGGTIRVESESGKGSTFVFTLPKQPAAAPETIAPACTKE